LSSQFTWIPFYEEAAHKLLSWEARQPELIAFLDDLRRRDIPVTVLLDRGESGERFLLREIDPFTFFGTFRGFGRGLPEICSNPRGMIILVSRSLPEIMRAC
jgi:hypothetical protein